MPDTDGRFTEAELETARETDLPDLLTSLGYQVKRVGSYYTTKEMDSLRIKNRRTWFRYSENRGGDAISFLERFEGKSFPEAVEYLLDYHGGARFLVWAGGVCSLFVFSGGPLFAAGAAARSREERSPLCPPAAEQR